MNPFHPGIKMKERGPFETSAYAELRSIIPKKEVAIFLTSVKA
jgi:hypothetical protein